MNTSKRSHFITFTLMVAIFAIAISLFISIPGLLYAYVPSSDSSNAGASAAPSSDSANGGASSGAPSSSSSNGGGAYVPSSDSSNGGSNPSSGGTPDTGSSNGGSTSSGPATPGTGSSNGGANPSSGSTPDTGSSNGGSTSSGPATPGTGGSNGGGTTDTTTPGTGSSNGGANPSSGSTPGTGSSNGGSTSSGPATPGTGSSNGGSNPTSGTTPSTGSSNGGSNTSGPATPGTGSSNGGANPSSGGNTGGGTGGGSIPSGPGGAGTSGGGNGPIVGSGYSGGGSIIFPPLPATSTPAAQAACVKLVNSLRLGASDNNPKDIRFLQTFLRDYEKADVTVNGIFDQKTFKAVENFQIKYRADILAPWGASLPSGYVYITTKKKINEIYCGKAITLTGSENTTINNFKARRAAAKAAGIENAPDIDLSEIGINPSSTSTDLANTVNTMPTTSVATASSSNSRFIEATASAIRSVPRSVYNFFRNLFGGDEK